MSDQYIVLLDLGNSFAKLSYLPLAKIIMEDDKIDAIRANIVGLNSDSFSHSIRIENKFFDTEKIVSSLLDNKISTKQISYVLVSSVRSNEFNNNLEEQLIAKFNKAKVYFCSTKQQHQELINNYQDIDKLGIDRWLAAIAVAAMAKQNIRDAQLNKEMNQTGSIIVDAGSAVTIDFVKYSESAKTYYYCGGKILPGLNKMTQSLSKTDKLPWVELSNNSAMAIDTYKIMSSTALQGFGLNTQDAIVAGVKSAMKGALLQTINELQQQGLSGFDIYVTGGDANIYESLMVQYNIVIKPHLVVIGMLLSFVDDSFVESKLT